MSPESVIAKAVRESIQRTVAGSGSRLAKAGPRVAIGILGAAALLPVALAVGAGAGSIALALVGLIGNVGESSIGNLVDDAIRRRRARKPGREIDEDELRETLQSQILERLDASGADAAALRQELSTLLRNVDAVEAALAAVSAELRGAVTERLLEVGETLAEFAWMLDEIRTRLADIQDRQAVQLEMQHVQLALSREQLAKTNELLERHEPRLVRGTDDGTWVDPPASPYKGLEVFQPEDADFFFGRERVVAELSARLAEAPFLAVVGASGSGKSSVVRAGLVPAVLKRRVARSAHWKLAMLTPGPRPLEQLVLRVAVELGVSPASMLSDLRAEPRAFDLAVRGVMLDEPEGSRFVLVVDQLEELFTLCNEEEERARFISALVGGLTSGDVPLTVVVTLRADFYGRAGAYPELAALLQDHQVVVGAMTANELLSAIVEPAERVGAKLERGLAETILADLGDAPGALPLLSHALFETWERREGPALTLAAYRAAGGVREAIARSAERVYCDELTDNERPIARGVFVRLTQLGEGTEDTRRPAAPAELMGLGGEPAVVEAVLGKLVRARLVTVADDAVDVAHEALLRQWPRLREWLDSDREGHRTHRRLTNATQEWLGLGRDPAVLYRGSLLAAATAWADDNDAELTADEREFLAASRRAVEEEEQRLEAAEQRQRAARRRILRSAAVVLGAASVIAVAFGLFALAASRRAADERRTSDLRALAIFAPADIQSEPERGSLLSVAAYRAQPSREARDAVFRATQATAGVIGVLRGGYSAAEVSPDGSIVALGCEDGRIRLWDVAGRRMLTPAPPCAATGSPKRGVHDLAFSASGRTLAAGTNGSRIEVWELSDPRTPRRVAESDFAPDLTLSDFAISPDGETVAAVQSEGTTAGLRRRLLGPRDSRLVMWNVRSGRVTPLTGGPVDALQFTPDGRELVAALSGVVYRLDLAGWRWKPALRLPGDCCGRTAIDRTGRYVAAENFDQVLTVWDVRSRTQVRRWARRDEPGGYGIAVTSAREVVLGNYNGVQRYSEDRGPETLGGHRGSVVTTSLGRHRSLVTLDNRGTVVVRDAEGEIATALPVTRFAEIAPGVRAARALQKRLEALPEYAGERKRNADAILSADGSRFAIVDGFGTPGRLVLGEADSLRRVATVGFPEKFNLVGAEFSPSGDTIAVFGDGIELRDGRTGQRRTVLPRRGEDSVGDVAFTADGRRMIVSYDSGDLVIWDIPGRRQLGRAIQAHADSSFVAVSPDGSVVASGGRDTFLKLWDLASQRPLGEPMPTQLPVEDLAFDRSGRLIMRTKSEQSDASRLVAWAPALTDLDLAAERLCAIAGRDLNAAERRNFLPDEDQRVCPA